MTNSNSQVIETEACCKVVSQKRHVVGLLLQTSPEPLQLILASKDCVAIELGMFGWSGRRGREKRGCRVLLTLDIKFNSCQCLMTWAG